MVSSVVEVVIYAVVEDSVEEPSGTEYCSSLSALALTMELGWCLLWVVITVGICGDLSGGCYCAWAVPVECWWYCHVCGCLLS